LKLTFLKISETSGKTLTNDQKAEIFELTVNIHNNLALCNMKIEDYSQAVAFGNYINMHLLTDILTIFDLLLKRRTPWN